MSQDFDPTNNIFLWNDMFNNFLIYGVSSDNNETNKNSQEIPILKTNF